MTSVLQITWFKRSYLKFMFYFSVLVKWIIIVLLSKNKKERNHNRTVRGEMRAHEKEAKPNAIFQSSVHHQSVNFNTNSNSFLMPLCSLVFLRFQAKIVLNCVKTIRLYSYWLIGSDPIWGPYAITPFLLVVKVCAAPTRSIYGPYSFRSSKPFATSLKRFIPNQMLTTT